jgi:hypothetical protein
MNVKKYKRKKSNPALNRYPIMTTEHFGSKVLGAVYKSNIAFDFEQMFGIFFLNQLLYL